MKKIVIMIIGLIILMGGVAQARMQYINPYIRNDGTNVSGHYKDTSGDGNPYNNASYLGYNRKNSGYNPYTGW